MKLSLASSALAVALLVGGYARLAQTRMARGESQTQKRAEPDRPAATELFVSAEGNDAWSGKLEKSNAAKTDGPLATVAGARDAIRKMKAGAGLRQSICVHIGEGTFRISKQIVFEAQDSGTQAYPITYEGTAGKSIISGGRPITGWRKEGDRWTVHVPEVEEGKWSFASLWVNGTRRPRARIPNEGYLYTAGKAPPRIDPKSGKTTSSAKWAFRYKPGDLPAFSHPDEAVVVVYQSWEVAHQRIAKMDKANHVLTFRRPLDWAFDYWGEKVRYTVENVPEGLDAPGEWYLDKKTGILTYLPLPGEDIARADVIAPVAEQLLVLRGKPAKKLFVSNLIFRNLQWTHTEWEVPPEGHASAQAACDFSAAIESVGARFCVIENCQLAHLANYGIWFRAGCQDNRVVRNDLHDLGAGGVRLGEMTDAPSAPEIAERNTVENNWIHDGGKIDPGAVGVWIGRSSYNHVSHNEISDLYYTGVSVGWSWGYAPPTAHHNVIEWNHIHDIGRGVLGDMGGIYCLGDSPGTVVRNNVVHDVYDHGTGSLAIYTDEGSTGILIENNIWAFGKDYQISRAREENHNSFTFERNIVYFDSGKLLRGKWANDRFVIDRNVYWDVSRPNGVLSFAGATWAKWQARGHDVHSLIADPRFVNASHYDFRLRPDSPALKLGFVPIDASEVGLQGDPKWVNAPRLIKRTPYVPKK